MQMPRGYHSGLFELSRLGSDSNLECPTPGPRPELNMILQADPIALRGSGSKYPVPDVDPLVDEKEARM